MKVFWLVTALLAVAFDLAGQAPVRAEIGALVPTGAQARPTLQRGEYRVGQDDVLEISVFEIPELGTVSRVTASGYVSLPLVGPVEVAGWTVTELAEQVAVSLRANYVKDPHVTVFVREYASQPVSMIGAVNSPGIYQIKGEKRLLEMLSMAGGLAGNPGSTIQIIRASSALSTGSDVPTQFEAVDVDIEALLEKGKTELNIPVYAGDVINVQQAGSIFVIGETIDSGEKVLRNGRNVTVTQAVALAGGFTPDARRDESMIIRVHSNGTREEIPVGDPNRMLSGEVLDVALLPNDILWIPPNKAKPILRRVLDTTIGVVTSIVIFSVR